MVPNPNHNCTLAPTCLTLPQKTSVPKKTEKKRGKAPVKRRFKVRVIVQPLLMNPTLPVGPTPTVVTTTATSTQMPVAKPATTTAKSSLIPVMVDNLAPGKFKEIPYPTRKPQKEEGPSTPSSNNPPKAQQPESTTTATAPQNREDTPWPNTMPPSTHLFVARESWPTPPILKSKHPPLSKQKRQR